ncbi:response regulator [Nitrospira lenta]|uniref:Response regulatory domain-containing protein n=1 Tax=Nitrospira lenta TaxID=1436998 RepID=A0A330L2A2_9BACT|nr:response regulator [Nitrospira lenta]SPP63349.1 hypothetical protein NITLEN_10435 [Nitrospira lenta]
MPTILLISDDDTFRNTLRQSMGKDGAAVLGVPNTRAILSQPGTRQVSGYDLIVAEVLATDHDGLSRLVLFRNLHPNTPFIAVTREDQSTGLAYGGAAARALHAWLVPVATDSMAGLTDTTARALNGELPPTQKTHTR